MSDNWIRLIPENPRLVPETGRQIRAKERFAELAPNADEIEIKVSESIEFFDCGGNFERARCPSCGEEIPNDWWQDRMGEDYENGFRLAPYPLPCCNTQKTLHEFSCEWPQGFGLFALDAMNPNMESLKDEHKEEFERILGTPLRVIYRHI